jgi:tetratricopeptide (TPR) repeat protein
MIRLPAPRPGRRGLTLLAIASLLLAVLVQGRIEARAAGRDAVHPLMYLPSGRYLRVAAIGFDGLLADLIYLWSIQYYGNYAIADRFRYLEQIYTQVITELDPHYLDPYLVGALIMTVEARQPEAALRLLDKGIRSNPDKWILAFEAGFVCYNDLRDYARAAAYFEQALKAPDVHPTVRRLYAEMYNRAGDKRHSLNEWAGIYETATDDYVRSVAWNHVHDLKVEVDLTDLREAIGLFQKREGRVPRHLDELAARGLLREVPRDPEGRAYRYEPLSGAVGYGGGLVLGR